MYSIFDWISQVFFTSYEPDYIVNCVDFTVIHTLQEDEMDCGPACIRMVHKWATGGIDTSGFDLRAGRCEPWWSIDLFEVLRHMKICQVEFYTTCTGIGTHHRNLDWYLGGASSAQSVEKDFQRVQAQFSHGLASKWPIFNKKFDDYDLIVALAVRRALVIALVHNPTLSAHAGRQGYFLFSSLEQSSIGVIAEQGIDYAADDSGDVRRNESEDERFVSFHGHYIVIIGFDSQTGEYLVLNPSSVTAAVERYPVAVVRDARSHVGTDNDVLVCYPISVSG